MYRWRIEVGTELIRVSTDGGPEWTPTLSKAQTEDVDRVARDWGIESQKIGDRWGVPRDVLLAMIWQESRGNRNALRREPDGRTGVGLMQITSPSLKLGYTDDHIMSHPEVGIELGSRYIASLMKRYGRDWPSVFAAYNAGGVYPSKKNDWGLACTGCHVDAEVGAYNHLRLVTLDEESRTKRAVEALQIPLFEPVFSPHEREVNTE